MSAPLITLTAGRIKEGALGDYRRLNARITEFVRAEEPRVIAFHVMLSEDGTRFAGVQVHPDVQSMELHMQVAGELIRDAGDVLQVESFTVLGPSSAAFDKMMSSLEAAGVAVQHLPEHLGGFTRSSAVD
jgi:hypothetical protein